MELRHLRYFVAVAEHLNFTRAAEELRTAQPSLSQQIRDLEDEIGTPLLVRTKRRVALTEAGQVFLEEARLVLAQAQRAVARARQAAQLEGRSLTVGFVPAAEVKIFPSMLTSLRAMFPSLSLILRSLTTAEQRDGLLRGTVDLAFMRLPLGDARLAHEVVLSERLVAVLPGDHPLARRDVVSMAELAEVPFVRISPPHAGSLHDVIEEYFRTHGVRIRPLQDVENVLTCVSLVGMGVGFTLLPDYAEHLLFKNVVARRIEGAPARIDLAMVWRGDDESPELAAFQDLVRRTLGLIAD